MPTELSAAEARRLAITAQGLAGRRHSDPRRLLDDLGAIQLDTISVLARSHELVCFARLRSATRDRITSAFWGGRGDVVEYWAHAACVVPMSVWSLLAWRRRAYRERYGTASADGTKARREVLRRLHDLGPITTADLDGARTAPGWWEWSPLKSAVEQLLAMGDVVCVERRGWRRVYDLPERALPADVLASDPDDAACTQALVSLAGRCLGVATVEDLADYFRLPLAAARRAVVGSGLTEVRVATWSQPAFAHPLALSRAATPISHRPVLLSPFDSLIWYRPRSLRLFDFHHRLEAYVPRDRREHGYFSMPLLAGGRIAGRVDPKRDGTTLIARHVSVEKGAVSAMADALADAAAWVGCDRVVMGEDVGPAVGASLRAALARN